MHAHATTTGAVWSNKADILLSAFGNAKTPRNDDSSRFAKMIKLYIDKTLSAQHQRPNHGSCGWSHRPCVQDHGLAYSRLPTGDKPVCWGDREGDPPYITPEKTRVACRGPELSHLLLSAADESRKPQVPEMGKYPTPTYTWQKNGGQSVLCAFDNCLHRPLQPSPSSGTSSWNRNRTTSLGMRRDDIMTDGMEGTNS